MGEKDPRQEWATAFVGLQGEMPEITKNKKANIQTNKGASFSYTYADLPDILKSIRPHLTKHGFGVAQSVGTPSNGLVSVTTRIYHSAGHFEEFGPVTLPAGNDARSAGSAITYARRYGLCAALNIAADEDDDGQLASQSTAEARRPQPSDYQAGAEVSADSKAGSASLPGAEPKAPTASASQPETRGKGHRATTPSTASPSLALIQQAIADKRITQQRLLSTASRIAMQHDAVPKGGIAIKTLEQLPEEVLTAIAGELGLQQEAMV